MNFNRFLMWNEFKIDIPLTINHFLNKILKTRTDVAKATPVT
jgi:hypothetical protein